MADSRWIPDLTATTPVADAALWVLAVRLETVRTHLRNALRKPGEDIEHVHRLRVGTRRASAALDLFVSCLPEPVYRRARKYLRSVRRAAGAARDWDVFVDALLQPEQLWSDAERPGIDLLCGYAVANRAEAQQQLEGVASHFPFDFERHLADVLGAVSLPGHGRKYLIDLARPLLTERLGALDRAAARDQPTYDELHQVRITGKRLRYAMEVFASCFGPAFREEIYPAVAQLQEVLGLANDSHVTLQRLVLLQGQATALQPVLQPRIGAALKRLIAFHERRLHEQQQHYLDWLRDWQQRRVDEQLVTLLNTSHLASVQGAGVANGFETVNGVGVPSPAATGAAAPAGDEKRGINGAVPGAMDEGAAGTTGAPGNRGEAGRTGPAPGVAQGERGEQTPP